MKSTSTQTSTSDWLTLDELGISPQDLIQVLMDRTPYKTSEDKKGHDMTLYARFPKYIGHWMELILEKKGIPYQTRSDLMRDACFLGMIVLHLRYNTIGWRSDEVIAQIEAEVARRADFSKRVSAFLKDLATINAAHGEEDALKLLQKYIDAQKDPKKIAYVKAQLTDKGFAHMLEKLVI